MNASKLTDHFDAADGPPEELLAEWKGIKAPLHPALPKACGMTGLRPASAPVMGGLNELSDLGAIFTACATPLLKLLATMAISSIAPAYLLASNPTCHVNCLSSPPPAIEDELAACLQAFGASCAIASDSLDKAVDGLDEVCYTPDIMGKITAEHLQALTGLPEGHTIALCKFACEWCGKMDAKRAHHT